MDCKYNAKRSLRAFSLIEVTLAIGILSVAILPLVALLPVGLNMHRQAIDSTVSTQIVSSVTHELEQTSFSEFTAGQVIGYCFDEQGTLLASGTPSTVFATGTITRLYDVIATFNYSSTLPKVTNVATPSLARVKILVASNPARLTGTAIFMTDGNGNYTHPVSTYFALISKND